MTDFNIVNADVMTWCAEYDGPKFHALLTDAPFHLTANGGGLETCPKCGAKMARRYRYCHQCGGEMDTEAAKSGFMGKDWDGGILAFQPELWQALARHLYPGAFILAFASGRGWHRVAVALEDAGMVYQPDVHVHGVGVVNVPGAIHHIVGQAFPKSTQISAALEKTLCEKRADKKWYYKDTGKPIRTKPPFRYGEIADGFFGHRYGGQIPKDMSLPIVCAQKPWAGNRLDCIVETGSGAMNVELGRVATGDNQDAAHRASAWSNHKASKTFHGQSYKDMRKVKPPSGRWPPNCVFTHHPLCEPILVPAPCPACDGSGGSDGNGGACETCGGTGEVEVGAVERVRGSGKPGGIRNTALGLMDDDAWEPKPTVMSGYAEGDGREPVTRYRCARHCAGCGCWWLSETATVCPECGEVGEWGCSVKLLGEDSGESASKRRVTSREKTLNAWRRTEGRTDHPPDTGKPLVRSIGDAGTAARFFPNPDFSHETAERQFWQDAAERLALGQPRKYAAKPSRAEKDAGLEGFERKQDAHNLSSNACARCGKRIKANGSGDKCECGELRETVKLPTTSRNSHPTVKSISLDTWLCNLLAPPPEYAPRRLLIPFLGSGSELCAAVLSGQWEHVTGIEMSEEYCQIAEARTRFWTGWSAATGETEVKPILKAAKKAQREPGQTPQPPASVQPVAEQLTMEAIG